MSIFSADTKTQGTVAGCEFVLVLIGFVHMLSSQAHKALDGKNGTLGMETGSLPCGFSHEEGSVLQS